MSSTTHLTDFLEINARQTPRKLAVVTPDRSMTWAELWEEVQVASSVLAARLPSDSQAIVGVLMPNSWQHVIANLAIVHAGHITLPVDVIFKPMEINAVIDQMHPAMLIADDAGMERIDQSRVTAINFNDLARPAGSINHPYLRLPSEKQIASLFFTSGTTGTPKAVPNTHLNHIWNIEACSKVWAWTNNDTQLVSARLSHMLGLVMGLSGSLYHGSTMFLLDRFNAEETLKILASGKVTMFSHGPLVYAKLLEDKNVYDLSKVRVFISGSGPLAPSIWRQFKQKFGAEILEVYGTTESGRIASNLLNERIPGSPGRPLPGVDVKIDDHGQVLVRSPGVFPGYWNNLDATKQAIDSDGFYKTGDIGEFVDERLVLKGRVQEKIRRQGYTISPRDIEWALHQDPRIKEVAVVGVQQQDQPNDVLAYFIVGKVHEQEIVQFSKDNLPSVWRPNKIFVLDQLPRTRTGKPDLKRLRAMVN